MNYIFESIEGEGGDVIYHQQPEICMFLVHVYSKKNPNKTISSYVIVVFITYDNYLKIIHNWLKSNVKYN